MIIQEHKARRNFGVLIITSSSSIDRRCAVGGGGRRCETGGGISFFLNGGGGIHGLKFVQFFFWEIAKMAKNGSTFPN
ncbi:hypothetical protein Hdeb2414_s0006g00203831 [Helianthus debilis subsp. tardiflorus]